MSVNQMDTEATFEATLECGKDNKEGQCCCHINAAVKPGNIQYGHTYTFSSVSSPSIDIKASAGPCELNQKVPIDVYALPTDGQWKNPGDWRKVTTINVLAQCPNRPPHTETTVDVSGNIKGLLLGSSTWTVDVSIITVSGEPAPGPEPKPQPPWWEEWQKWVEHYRTPLIMGGVVAVGATSGYLLTK